MGSRGLRLEAEVSYNPQHQLIMPYPRRDMSHRNCSTIFSYKLGKKILDRPKHIGILGPQGVYHLVSSSMLLGKLFKFGVLVFSSIRWELDVQPIQLWALRELMLKHLAGAGTWA